ncbi:MAG: ATP-grasp domain-containing protein, partial [Rhodothermales bacterium]|nr:ATP-grasp domain-containing protein [Rhodothermales bacterium]
MQFKSIRDHLVSETRKPVVLCLASYFKGGRFLEACKSAGAYVILITKEKFRYEPWPFDSIDEFHAMPDLLKQPDITHGVAYLARRHTIDAIVALDEYDALIAADLREHMRLPGLGHTQARYFRDKLAMRTRARDARIRMPRFVSILNHAKVGEFLDSVPSPWVLKPRMEASAMGIRKIDSPDEVWVRIEELGDQQSHFLLEEFVQGDVYHVDSIVTSGKVVFVAPSRYQNPPLSIYQGGGVFQTTTVDLESKEASGLAKANKRLLKAFGLTDGVAHAEFIRGSEDGKLYFLEVAARVGGAGIDQLVEAAYGVNMWEEWARNVVSS